MSSRDKFWLVLWLVLAVAIVARATSRKPHRGVILDHVEFGRRLMSDEELYGPWRTRETADLKPLHPPYPPSYGLLTMPFALVAETLGIRSTRALWAITQLLALVGMAWVLQNLPTGRSPPGRRFNALWLVTLLIMARFVLRDTHGGGGNLINIGLCVLSFYLAERGQQTRAGWLLGFSLATKPTQLWLLLVFWLLGHRRATGQAMLAGSVCVLVSLVALRFDITPWQIWIEGSWALATQADAFAVPALGFPEFEWMNQSLRCAIARWFGEVPPAIAARVPGGIAPGLGLSLELVAWITRLASLLLLAVVLRAAWRARQQPGPARTWVFAAALALSVLLSPLSWKAHHVALLPLVFLMVRRAAERPSLATIWLLAVYVPCCTLGGDLMGDANAEWVNSVYIVTAFDIALLLAAVHSARVACPTDTSPMRPEHDVAGQRS